jgi:hypothetical protein
MNKLNNWRTRPAHLTGGGFQPVELHGSLRNAAVLMVAFALMLAVTTRYTDYANSGAQATGSVVHQNLENKRQHIEKTSFVWLVALANLVRLKPPAVPSVAIVDVPVIKALYGEDLYNRPPPLLS